MFGKKEKKISTMQRNNEEKPECIVVEYLSSMGLCKYNVRDAGGLLLYNRGRGVEMAVIWDATSYVYV